MKRGVAFPISALLVTAMTALASYAVYLSGMQWFVQTPSLFVVFRNTALVAVVLGAGWAIIPRSTRFNAAAQNMLLIAGTLFGLGLAVQFRLGAEAPRQLSNNQITGLRDSLQKAMPGVPPDTVRRMWLHAVRAENSRLRRTFEAAREDVRLARSLERAYGPTDLTRRIIDGRTQAPTDSIIYRLLPVLAVLLALLLASRSTLLSMISARWRTVGFYGSIAVCVLTAVYMKFAGGVRGANFSPQEFLKLTVPIAWAGLLIYYRSAFLAETRQRFAQSPVTMLLYILGLLTAPLAVFVTMRDFGQFLVIGIAQILLLACFTRSALYVALFAAALIASGAILLSGGALSATTLWTVAGIVGGGALAMGALERFRTRDGLWMQASGILAGFAALVMLATQLPPVQHMLQTPRQRFMLWADLYNRNGNPDWWDNSRQTIEALYAFDAGGLTGQTLGNGTPFLIPKAGSDFAFAAIGEELGLPGTAVVILLFAALAVIGLRLSRDLGENTFPGLIVGGYVLLLCAQALVHIAGTLNLLPMTGITLPFVSGGMSSMVISWAMLGVVVGLACRPVPTPETIVIKNRE